MTRPLISGLSVVLTLTALTTSAAQFKFATQTLTVPDGFEVEIVAGTDLVPRPVSGSFDELGRLYVTDSSGSNAKPSEQTNNPTHRVLRLEDTDGDGKFDKSVVFADKVMFPEGCLWYDGSVYVAAPPHIWKFTDTNNDGVADQREIWHDGQTLTGCANDLHGPFLGPDGWIYWCKGAFAEQTYEVNGKPWKSRASHIFRARPDHSHFEPVITAGNDNPVGLTWTATGERILCGTFFAPHEPGHRDGMIHAVYGGVWGKPNSALDGHKMTGDLMPVMTHMGAAAPCAVTCYKSTSLGNDYQGNVFCCQFNLHKVSRHILVPDGATFKTTDSDFLISDNPDFHPTDVIEDADGSLLVLDTGAWYKLCCPTSQLAKPDVLGAIYRIRRKGAPKTADPRGLRLAWKDMKADTLVQLLDDPRIAVATRATIRLGGLGDSGVTALISDTKAMKSLRWTHRSLGTLADIGSPKAVRAIMELWKSASEGETPEADRTAIKHAALNHLSLLKSAPPEALAPILAALACDVPELRRVAAELTGRAADSGLTPGLLRALAEAGGDRFVFHSATYALIELNSPVLLRKEAANNGSVRVWRGTLIALDQMDSGSLKPEEVLPHLQSPDAELRQTAAWVAGHHPDWGGALAGFFRERLTASDLKEADRAELEKQLAQFMGNEAIQQVVVDAIGSAVPVTRQLLLRVMAGSELASAPQGWPAVVSSALMEKDDALVLTAISAARVLGQVKNNPPSFSESLLKLARDTTRPADLRLEALAAMPKGMSAVEPDLMNFLLAHTAPTNSVAMRGAAAGALTKSQLSENQLLQLAHCLKACGPMEVARMLPAFERSTSEAVGLQLMAALQESKGLSGVRPDQLLGVATNYPTTVKQQAVALLARLNEDAAKQKAHLEELLKTLPAGDIRRGQLVFNNPKSACASCHRMGYLGGKIGPDLTNIGQVRSDRDLLEAVVYPSASFVRSYEPLIVQMKNDEEFSGVVRKDAADEIVLATGPETEIRIARSDISEMRPGTVSVMPAGLDQQLSTQELADLIAFLKNTKWGVN